MPELVLTTYDWVPEPPRGYVRDLRVRWALEEAGLAYRVATTPFQDRGGAHLAHQPFAQVPWLEDGEISIFETGAILLYLGDLSERLMPPGRRGRADVTEWLLAALNSVEAYSQPWVLMAWGGGQDTAERQRWEGFFQAKLQRMAPIFADREWLAGGFSVADIVMADVLRLPETLGALADHPAARAYLARATARPAFAKAYADQMAHFAAAVAP